MSKNVIFVLMYHRHKHLDHISEKSIALHRFYVILSINVCVCPDREPALKDPGIVVLFAALENVFLYSFCTQPPIHRYRELFPRE
jgi:hypothetical protein